MNNLFPTPHPEKPIGYYYPIGFAVLIYTLVLASSIAGQNLINVFGLVINSGVFIYPLTFIFVAASTELYGFKCTRVIILCVACCQLLMALIIYSFTFLPSPRAFIGNSDIYHHFSSRLSYLLTLSVFAYLISENINSFVIAKLKIITGGKLLLLRASFSTSIAIIVDTWLIFPFFATRQPELLEAFLETLIVMGVKLLYDVLLIPIFWIIVELVKRLEKMNIANILPESALPFSSVAVLRKNYKEND